MKRDVVGIILAGGQSRRMGGGDKCLLPLGSGCLLDHVILRLAPQVAPLALSANGDPARFILAQRGINHPLPDRDVTVNDGEIFLGHRARFPEFAQFTGGSGIFGDDDQAGSFAIQPVHQTRFGIQLEINPGAADETGIFVALRRMTHKVGGLVDDEQVGVLVDDGEKLFQVVDN